MYRKFCLLEKNEVSFRGQYRKCIPRVWGQAVAVPLKAAEERAWVRFNTAAEEQSLDQLSGQRRRIVVGRLSGGEKGVQRPLLPLLLLGLLRLLRWL